MASADVEIVQPKRSGLAKKWQSTKNYIYNPEKGEFLERDCGSWMKIGAFYLVFYSCLAGFFAMMMAIFFVTIDANTPRRTGYDSLIKKHPGMGFRPMPNHESTLIHFEQGKLKSYKKYTDNIEAFLHQYESDNQKGDNYIDCKDGRPANSEDKVCRFSLSDLGTECTAANQFGYQEGMPCVLLKLNKVFGWTPEAYKNGSAPSEVENYNPDDVTVTCTGENAGDQENLGEVTFYPPGGFNTKYFPYMNQEGYRQPIVMARFSNPTNGVIIQVWCRAWAANLKHHRNDMAASIHFELLVD